MNELMERFEIIRLAVKLTDHETVDLQMHALRNSSTDQRLHDILDELESKNFRQALYQMQTYMEDKGSLFQRTEEDEPAAAPPSSTSPNKTHSTQQMPTQSQGDGHVVSVEEMLAMTHEGVQGPRKYKADTTGEPADSDAAEGLFSITDDEGPSTDASTSSIAAPETFAETPEHVDPAKAPFDLMQDDDTNQNDALFDLDDHLQSSQEMDRSAPKEEIEEDLFDDATQKDLPHPDETTPQHISDATHDATESSSPESTDPSPAPEHTLDETPKTEPETDQTGTEDADRPVNTFVPGNSEEQRYEAFAYMSQKFRNMLHQYPQLEPYEKGVFPEAQTFIDRVSMQNYTESEVETAIARYQELKVENQTAEAAQMLIAAATTESAYAQFMLARELFKGDVLKPDHPEAFTQINHLAERNFPEAICDLGQLYEHGIGIDRNRNHALTLYQEAAQMGIARAHQHYERLQHSNPLRSVISLFKKR